MHTHPTALQIREKSVTDLTFFPPPLAALVPQHPSGFRDQVTARLTQPAPITIFKLVLDARTVTKRTRSGENTRDEGLRSSYDLFNIPKRPVTRERALSRLVLRFNSAFIPAAHVY